MTGYAAAAVRSFTLDIPRYQMTAVPVLALSAAIGIALNFTAINPISALYWSAVINGVVAVPIMAGLMLLAGKKEVMGSFTSGRKTSWFGWGGVAVMGIAVLMMLKDLFF